MGSTSVSRRRWRSRRAAFGRVIPLGLAASITPFVVTDSQAQQTAPPPPPPTPVTPQTPVTKEATKAPPTGADGTKAQSPNPAPAGPQAAISRDQPLTLAQAIEIALENQPQVKIAGENRIIAAERVRQASSRYLPTLTPQYSYTDQSVFTQGGFTTFTNGVPITQSTRDTTTRIAELGLNYRLLDSGTRNLTARQARQSFRAQQYSEVQTRQNVIGNVSDAYYGALRTAALVKVQQAQVARAQNTLEVVRAQVEVGSAPRKDILQAQADFLNAQVGLFSSTNNAAVSQATLKNAMGIVGGDALTLADVPPPAANATPIAVMEDPTPQAVNKSEGAPVGTAPGTSLTGDPIALQVNRYVDTAYRIRPDVGQSEQALDASRTGVGLSRIATGLNFTADLTYANRLDPESFNRRVSTNRLVNFGFTYPLFDGGLVRSQYRASQRRRGRPRRRYRTSRTR